MDAFFLSTDLIEENASTASIFHRDEDISPPDFGPITGGSRRPIVVQPISLTKSK
jgi:hypothetical protein